MTNPDYIVEIDGIQGAGRPEVVGEAGRDEGAGTLRGRPWLAVHWKCCQTYSRIYANPARTAYRGACPRCGSVVRATIGSEGTSSRFFTAE